MSIFQKFPVGGAERTPWPPPRSQCQTSTGDKSSIFSSWAASRAPHATRLLAALPPVAEAQATPARIGDGQKTRWPETRTPEGPSDRGWHLGTAWPAGPVLSCRRRDQRARARARARRLTSSLWRESSSPPSPRARNQPHGQGEAALPARPSLPAPPKASRPPRGGLWGCRGIAWPSRSMARGFAGADPAIVRDQPDPAEPEDMARPRAPERGTRRTQPVRDPAALPGPESGWEKEAWTAASCTPCLDGARNLAIALSRHQASRLLLRGRRP